MKLVFYVVDDDGKTIGDTKQIKFALTEAELVAADEDDVNELKANELIDGECYANLSSKGRGKLTRELFDSIGTIVGRHCWRLCASKFGVQRMFDLLDKHAKESKEIGL